MRKKLVFVELGIFGVVSLIFLNSVYNLFIDAPTPGIGKRRPVALESPESPKSPKSPKSDDDRRPAAAAAPRAETLTEKIGNEGSAASPALATEPASPEVSGLTPYETKCQPTEVFETGASKVRVLGPLCGMSGRQPGSSPSGAASEPGPTEHRIENATTRYVATVFSEKGSGRFSTDFIPLELGANRILMQFSYKGGRIVPIELTVLRKPTPSQSEN